MLVNCQFNGLAQLIKYNTESTNHKMLFHSKETEVKLLLNTQRKTKIKKLSLQPKNQFYIQQKCSGQRLYISVKRELFLWDLHARHGIKYIDESVIY